MKAVFTFLCTEALPLRRNCKLFITMYAPVEKYLKRISEEEHALSTEAERIAAYISEKVESGKSAKLIFICTHNSRRSHMAMLWAAACSAHYGFRQVVEVYSGGTESTAFYPLAVKAMENAGWSGKKAMTVPDIDAVNAANPAYIMSFSEENPPLICFSKHFTDEPNPRREFAAVMVCSDADKGCPLVPGAEARFSLPYKDPKAFDAYPNAIMKYDAACREIATEINAVWKTVSEKAIP